MPSSLLARRITVPRLLLIAVAALAVMTAAALLTGAGPARASARSVRLRAEQFQIISTSPSAKKLSIVATGVFTDGGILSGNLIEGGVGHAALRDGTFRMIFDKGSSAIGYTPGLCKSQEQGTGTYELRGGSGRYARISGSGKFTIAATTLYRRNSRGRCTSSVAAYQEIITGRGHARA
jgi:hypothetical protein